MTRSPHWVADVPELVWYHRDSACELGVRALPLVAFDAHVPALDLAWLEATGEPSPPPPSRKVQIAARRQQHVRRALALLSPRQRGAVELAYARDLEALGAPPLVAEFGRAAGIALRVQAMTDEAEHRVVVAIAAAKRAGGDVATLRVELRTLRLRAPDAAAAAAEVLRDAHERYVRVRREQRDADAADEAEAAHDGDGEREAQAARRAGKKPRAQTAERMLLAEVCAVMAEARDRAAEVMR